LGDLVDYGLAGLLVGEHRGGSGSLAVLPSADLGRTLRSLG
jgi:hypothetical protein